MTAVAEAFSDGAVVAKRNLIKIGRVPELIVFSLVSPIMFVLLFAYVFGAGIDAPGVSYKDFLMAGIFAQTVIFGGTVTGSGLAEDMQKGIIDRFRSLPMSRAAVLIGRTTSDVMNNVLVIVGMTLTGLLVGWRIHSSFFEALGGSLLLLLFAYSLSWGMAIIGLAIRSPEVFQQASFMAIFPLTFIANTFVPTDNMPTGLKAVAEWNPVSALTQAVRELFGNTNPAFPPPDAWPLRNAELVTLGWCAIMLAIFVPLAISKYKNAVSK